jgi:hypothetical protein
MRSALLRSRPTSVATSDRRTVISDEVDGFGCDDVGRDPATGAYAGTPQLVMRARDPLRRNGLQIVFPVTGLTTTVGLRYPGEDPVVAEQCRRSHDGT